jgi:nucleoside-diphosphate-sugar epimerase
MNILVTGATGLVGNLVTRRLISQNHKVRALVREPQRAEHLRDVSVELVQADLERPETLPEAVKGMDTIIHCAGLVGSGRATNDDYFRINLEGTRALLEAAKKVNLRRFVFMSTAGVYGLNMLKGNVDESTPLRESNGYTNSKIAAEEVVRMSGITYTILRPYWITGGGDRFLIPALARLLMNDEFVYIGDGQQEWSLSVVENISSAVATAATHPAAVNKIYNVTDATVKITETVSVIAKALGVRLPDKRSSALVVGFRSLLNQSDSNPARMTIDLFFPLWRTMTVNAGKIRRDLGWTPQVPWQDSVREGTLEWKQANTQPAAS